MTGRDRDDAKADHPKTKAGDGGKEAAEASRPGSAPGKPLADGETIAELGDELGGPA